MDAILKLLVGTSPKTTLSGLIFGLATALIPLLQAVPPEQGILWGFIAMGLGLIVVGRVSKDAGVTGGTKVVTS
jgi:CDP-diglyceride synthetase